MNVIGVETNFRIIADVEIKYDDETSSIVSVQENDIVNISYIKSSRLQQITGKIKRIDRLVGRVVIDASSIYENNVIDVDLSNVRSISIVSQQN